MLEAAPHKLQILVVTPERNDEYGRPIPGTGNKEWQDGPKCFCHDNSQNKEISVNGKAWVYSYHVVYEGSKIPLDTKVRCLGLDNSVIGEGLVIKNAECYSEELKGRCDIWI